MKKTLLPGTYKVVGNNGQLSLWDTVNGQTANFPEKFAGIVRGQLTKRGIDVRRGKVFELKEEIQI